MAQRDWEKLTERYRARLSRYGITPSYYESGGRLQSARGHKPREHITRRERNPAGLTATDYRFLKRQQIRATSRNATAPKNFSKQIAAYKRLSPRQRASLRERVTRMNREYRRRKSNSWQSLSDLKDTFKGIVVGGRSGGSGEEADYYDLDNYEDDFPDLDDLDDLMFYH